jgi:hypothetical protein
VALSSETNFGPETRQCFDYADVAETLERKREDRMSAGGRLILGKEGPCSIDICVSCFFLQKD